MGEWQPTAEFWRQLVAPDTRDADISRPYPFCLAYPVEGQVEALRGAVATAVGVPATVPVEAEDLPAVNVDQQLVRIDDLIAQAEKERPDLARARAQALAAQSHAESVRWRGVHFRAVRK